MAVIKMHVRDIIAVTDEAAWDIIPWQDIHTRIDLTFDDNQTLNVAARATVFSQYFWNFHRKFKDTQCLPKHHLLDSPITSNKYLELLGNVYWSCFYENDGKGASRELLMELAYTYCTDRIYNMISSRLSPWVTSVAAHDFMTMANHPAILEANNAIKPNGEGTEAAYKAIDDVINNDKQMANHPLTYAARMGLVKRSQVQQCVGPRGMVSDVDGYIFHRSPILPSFYKGFTEIVDNIVESRSGAISMFYQDRPMRNSEYLNRSVQLLCMSLMNLHRKDCGSRHYMDFPLHQDDVPRIAGMRVCLKDGKEVWATEDILKPYVGTTIKLRTILHCQNHDESGVCLYCYGAIGLSIPSGTNLGYVSAADICGATSQLVLSNKHYIASAKAKSMELTAEMVGWLDMHKDPSMVCLDAKVDLKNTSIILPSKGVSNLLDIRLVDDVRDLRRDNISSMEQLVFEQTINGTPVLHPIDLSGASGHASLSHPMLRYIKNQYNKTKQFVINHNNDFVIALKDWNIEDPILSVPPKQYNVVDFMNDVKSAITLSKNGTEKTNNRKPKIVDYDDPEEALMFFYRLINSKLDCHMTHIQVIIYCMMAANPDQNDFRLPMPNMPNRITDYTTLMNRRSFAAMLAYEKQIRAITDPMSYLIKNRQAHPLDAIVVPNDEDAIY